MKLVSITFRQACDFVSRYHRHHKPPAGWKFGVGCEHDGKLCGVAMCGRPVARRIDADTVIEVNRLCTDGTKNACSFLYSACARAARALGYQRIITYILETESGASLTASGWCFDGFSKGGTWSVPSRNRTDKAPLCRKKRYVKEL